MLILGLDLAQGGTGWALLHATLAGEQLRKPVALDVGHFVIGSTWSEARMREALRQLDLVVSHHVEQLGGPVLVVIEEPPPTFRRAASGRGAGKQARIGTRIGSLIGAVCLWALQREDGLYPWRVPVSEWRGGMRIRGVPGAGGAGWKASALLDVARRWPAEVWDLVAGYSPLLSGDARADVAALCRPSVIEQLDKDKAGDVGEALLIAEYAVTHYPLAPKGPTRAVRVGIGGAAARST